MHKYFVIYAQRGKKASCRILGKLFTREGIGTTEQTSDSLSQNI